MCTTLIVPGLNGSDEGHWQRHWLRDNPEATLVEQDDWQCPVLEDWIDRLETALATWTRHTSLPIALVACWWRTRLHGPSPPRSRERFSLRLPISIALRRCIPASSALAFFRDGGSPSQALSW